MDIPRDGGSRFIPFVRGASFGILAGRRASVHTVPHCTFCQGFNLLTLSLLFDSFLAPWTMEMVWFRMDNSGGFMVDNTEQDDGIIELTQVVEEETSDATDQDVIELTDIDTQIEGTKQDYLDLDFDTSPEDADSDGLFDDGDLAFDIDLDETIATVSEQENDISEPAEPILPVTDSSDSGEPVSEAPVTAIEPAVTQEQLDAALERVIEKKFAKIIEKSLLEVMEKVLEREIVDIRKRLQNDLDEIASS
jgi:hypothetical protein